MSVASALPPTQGRFHSDGEEDAMHDPTRIPEGDWKQLRKLKELALERLCASILEECRSIAVGEGSTSHKRYLALFRRGEKRDRDIAQAFDGLSRSTALYRLVSMCALGLVTEAELEGFSPQTRSRVRFRLGDSEEADQTGAASATGWSAREQRP